MRLPNKRFEWDAPTFTPRKPSVPREVMVMVAVAFAHRSPIGRGLGCAVGCIAIPQPSSGIAGNTIGALGACIEVAITMSRNSSALVLVKEAAEGCAPLRSSDESRSAGTIGSRKSSKWFASTSESE